MSHKILKFLIYGGLAIIMLNLAGCASIPIPGEIPKAAMKRPIETI